MKQWIAGIAVAIGTVVSTIGSGQAQDFPTREIRVVCGFPAGGGADIMCRYFAKQLQTISGKTFIVENQPGAAGNLAHGYVARQRPDGYVIYPVGGSTLAASLSLFKKPQADPLKDFDYLGSLFKQAWFITVDAKSPYKTLPELTAALKQKGSKASFATSTTIGNVMGEMYKQIAGLDAVQVQYKTMGDSLNDLLGGNIDYMVADAPYLIGQMKAGRLRPLAIGSGERMKSVPDVPTMTEGGVPGIDLLTWWVVAVPAGTPQPVKDKLSGWINEMVRLKETEEFFAATGSDTFILTPKEIDAYLRAEIKNWADYIQRARIEPM